MENDIAGELKEIIVKQHSAVSGVAAQQPHNYFGPIDSCKERWLKEMDDSLAELGVQPRHD